MSQRTRMKQQDKELPDYLASLEPMSMETVLWRGDQLEMEIFSYITAAPPPDHLTTSGRCIILGQSSVLMMENPSGKHILPGGRRKRDESPRDATIREVMEETGLAVSPGKQLGVLVYRHLTPKPPIYPYPYPVFLNAIYVACTTARHDVTVDDTYELSAAFVDDTDVLLDTLPLHQITLLRAAFRQA